MATLTLTSTGRFAAGVACADNDVLYGPYADIATAHNELLNAEQNVVGRTVGIQSNNTIEEYWYQGGTDSDHLVKKQVDVDLSDYASKQDINGKANTSDLADVATSGNYGDLNNKPNIPSNVSELNNDSGYLTTHQDISGKADKVAPSTNGNFAALDKNGNLTDSGSSASSFATAAQGEKADAAIPMPINGNDGQILEKDSNEDGGVKWVNKPTDGTDGKSAYELYVESVPSGQTILAQQEWLASLKANIGAFKFVAYDNTAESVFTNGGVGTTYANTIDNLTAGTDTTTDTILLMNDAASSPTKTLMIATQDNGNSGYEFVYAGDLQSAMSSNVLTDDKIDNDFAGGSDNVASAEEAKTLQQKKLDKQKTHIEYSYTELETTTTPFVGYLSSTGNEIALSKPTTFQVNKYTVTPSNEYYISGSEGTSFTNALAGFYDANDTLIQDSLLYAEYASKVVTREKVIAPNGAAFIKIMTKDYTNEDFKARCETRTENEVLDKNYEAIIESVGDISELETTEKETIVEAINEINSTLDNICETHISPNLFDKSQVSDDDKIIFVGGNLGTVPTYNFNKRTPLISVESNKFYQISGCNITDGRNIRCVAADGTTIMKVLAPETGAEYSENYRMPNTDGSGASSTMNVQFKTPSNAAYVQFNVATDIDSSETTMLELVGDTYNPNFVPSEYEQYDEKTTVVKESALPDINIERIDEAIEKSEEAIGRKFKIKILLVGSSHGMNTIAQVPWICYNSTNRVDVEVGNVYIGSFSLQRLVGKNNRNETCSLKYFKDGSWTTYTNKTFSEVFSFTDWDFISIQRSATEDELWLETQNQADITKNVMTNINYGTELTPVYMSHNEAMQYVLNLIRDNVTKNAEIVFNSGFADPSEKIQTNQTENIITAVNKMKAQFGIDYIPTAIAVRNARNTFLRYIGAYDGSYSNDENAANNLCYDTQHLDYGIGCYVAGICFLEFIFRKIGWDTINLDGFGSQEELYTFISAATNEHYTEPNEETMMVAKACAKCACNTPNTLSTMLQTRFKWKVTQQLGAGITSSNTKGYSTDKDNYVTTLTGATSVSVTSRGWDRTSDSSTLVSGTDYTFTNNVLTINSIEGDIVITAN